MVFESPVGELGAASPLFTADWGEFVAWWRALSLSKSTEAKSTRSARAAALEPLRITCIRRLKSQSHSGVPIKHLSILYPYRQVGSTPCSHYAPTILELSFFHGHCSWRHWGCHITQISKFMEYHIWLEVWNNTSLQKMIMSQKYFI